MPRSNTANTDADVVERHDSGREPIANKERLLAIAQAAARGEARAVSMLYRERFDQVFLAARRASGRDEQFCLDVVQETFVRVMRSRAALGLLKDDEHVERWLTRVAQTIVLDMLRAERRRSRRELSASMSAAPGAKGDALRRLAEELASLPEAERELLRLRSTGATLATIAELVGSKIGVVQGRLRRTIAGLARTKSEVDHD